MSKSYLNGSFFEGSATPSGRGVTYLSLDRKSVIENPVKIPPRFQVRANECTTILRGSCLGLDPEGMNRVSPLWGTGKGGLCL